MRGGVGTGAGTVTGGTFMSLAPKPLNIYDGSMADIPIIDEWIIDPEIIHDEGGIGRSEDSKRGMLIMNNVKLTSKGISLGYTNVYMDSDEFGKNIPSKGHSIYNIAGEVIAVLGNEQTEQNSGTQDFKKNRILYEYLWKYLGLNVNTVGGINRLVEYLLKAHQDGTVELTGIDENEPIQMNRPYLRMITNEYIDPTHDMAGDLYDKYIYQMEQSVDNLGEIKLIFRNVAVGGAFAKMKRYLLQNLEELKEAKLIYETRGQVEREYLESEADAINAMF